MLMPNVNENNLVPFISRSQRFAINLMKTVGIKKGIIDEFKKGRIVKTEFLNFNLNIHSEILEQDKFIISELETNGFLVYSIIYSYSLIGKAEDIIGEYEISMFEKVVTIKNYLCVPSDIYKEACLIEEDLIDHNEDIIINDYIERYLYMAKLGFLFAYVVNDEENFSEFQDIEVAIFDGHLLRIN